MLARFNYLEKLPLRKMQTSKYSIGVPVDDRSEKVLIVEVVDENDSLNSDQIRERKHLSKTTDKNKYIRAYYLDPNHYRIGLFDVQVKETVTDAEGKVIPVKDKDG